MAELADFWENFTHCIFKKSLTHRWELSRCSSAYLNPGGQTAQLHPSSSRLPWDRWCMSAEDGGRETMRRPRGLHQCLMQEAEPQRRRSPDRLETSEPINKEERWPWAACRGGRRDESNDEKIHGIDVGPDSRGRRRVRRLSFTHEMGKESPPPPPLPPARSQSAASACCGVSRFLLLSLCLFESF